MRQGRTWVWSLGAKVMIFPVILRLKDATLTTRERTLAVFSMEMEGQIMKSKDHL